MAPPVALTETSAGAINPEQVIDHAANLKISSSSSAKQQQQQQQHDFKSDSPRINPKLKGAPIHGVDVTRAYRDSEFDESTYEFKDLLPYFPDLKWDPLVEEEYEDVALRADPTYSNLFKYVDEIEHLTPKFGSVLYGIKLEELDNKARDELARLIAFRGVVFVRDQKTFGVKEQLALGRHWGRLHRHATTGIPRGAEHDEDLLDVHVVHAKRQRIPTLAYTQVDQWHSDVAYEKQPPSYTTLKLLEGPPTGGGDTLWTSGQGLYDNLSPYLQEYLSKLKATHSAVEQANGARNSGQTVRREPVVSTHPIVRTNPVTGFNSVYVNSGFTRKIVGVPKNESEAILRLLLTDLSSNVTHTVRWKWQKNDVALWDNRSTCHTASYGFFPHARHAIRVTVHGETPYFSEEGKSEQETIDAELGIKSLHKDNANPPVYND